MRWKICAWAPARHALGGKGFWDAIHLPPHEYQTVADEDEARRLYGLAKKHHPALRLVRVTSETMDEYGEAA